MEFGARFTPPRFTPGTFHRPDQVIAPTGPGGPGTEPVGPVPCRTTGRPRGSGHWQLLDRQGFCYT